MVKRKINKKKKQDNNRKGFTLIELLATVAIIAVIGSISFAVYQNSIKNSKENVTALAINNVKEAAILYSKEHYTDVMWLPLYENDNNIEEIEEIEETTTEDFIEDETTEENDEGTDDSTENEIEESIVEESTVQIGKYVCFSVQQLINNGYFNSEFFKKDIYENQINENNFVLVTKNTNNAEFNATIDNESRSITECENSVLNLSMTEESYTDRIYFTVDYGDYTYDYGPTPPESEENKPVNFTHKGLTCDGSDCPLLNLDNKTPYTIRLCKNNQCDYIGIGTKDFENQTVEFEPEDSKYYYRNAIIKFNDNNIYPGIAKHYFKSEIEATLNNDIKIYKCTDFDNCENTNSNSVEKDVLYKVENNNDTGNELSLNINKDCNNDKKIIVYVQDGRNKTQDEVKIPTIKTTYTVNYDSNGGSGTTESHTCYYNKDCNLKSNNFSRTGYTFDSWEHDENITSPIIVDNMLENDEYNIKATWKINSYNINYNLNGGSYGTNHPTSSKYNEVVTISNPTKTGYIFTGWTAINIDTSTAKIGTTNNPTTAWNGTTETKNQYFKNLAINNGVTITLTANWIIDENAIVYKINYNLNGGVYGTNHPTSSKYPDVVTISNPTKAGYIFTGWTATNLNTSTAKTGSTNNPTTTWNGTTKTKNQYFKNLLREEGTVTFTANWIVDETAIIYNINYNLNSGTAGTHHPATSHINDVVNISNPTRSGYTFTGWTASNLNTSTAKTGSTNNPTTAWNGTTKTKNTYFKTLRDTTGTVTLTANWEQNIVTYSISYNLNGGSYGTNHPTSATEGTVITINNPTRSGYTFAGWTASNLNTSTAKIGTTNNPTTAWNGTTKTTNAYFKNLRNSTGTVTLTANWTANTYTISYNLNGGSYGTNHPTTGTVDSVVTINNPTRIGYNFAGWTPSGWNANTAKYGTSTSAVTTAWSSSSTHPTAAYYKNLRTDSGTVTLTANWTRTFSCAATGGTTTYMNKKWYTISNSGDYCELALNGTVGDSNGNAYDGSTGTTTGSVYNYIKGYGNGKDTIASEKGAGLVTNINANGGTGNAANVSGRWWYASGNVYYTSAVTTYAQASCDYYFWGGFKVDSDNSKKNGKGDLNRAKYCKSYTSTKYSGGVATTNTAKTRTFSNTKLTKTGIDYVSHYLNIFKYSKKSGNNVYFTREVWNMTASGSWDQTSLAPADVDGKDNKRGCPEHKTYGNTHCPKANSTTTALQYELKGCRSFHLTGVKSGTYIFAGGGNYIYGKNDGNRKLTAYDGGNSGGNYYNAPKSDCEKIDHYTVGSSTTVNFMYRPHIRVKK